MRLVRKEEEAMTYDLPADTGYHIHVDNCPIYYDGCHCPEALLQVAIDIVEATYNEPWEEGGEAKIALSKALLRLQEYAQELSDII